MIDIKTIRSNIKRASQNTPDYILTTSIECLKELKKDGFFTLSAGNDEKGISRKFTPFWSAVYFTVSCVSLFINIIVSGACVWLRIIGERFYKVLTLVCAVVAGLIALPVAYLILGAVSNQNKLTKFGMKITKA